MIYGKIDLIYIEDLKQVITKNVETAFIWITVMVEGFIRGILKLMFREYVCWI